jgi:cytochrome c553
MKQSRLVWLALVSLGMATSLHAAPVAQWELGLVLTRNPDLTEGAALYAPCVACHGAKGEGTSDGTVPTLAGQSYTVVAKQLVDFRAGVRHDERMEHFSNRRHLSFSQPVADVALYIARLPPIAAASARVGTDLSRGAMAYARACARCHGDLGEGKEDTLAPRLAGQHSEYLLKQLEAGTNGLRPTMVQSHAEPALSKDELGAVAGYLSTLGP